MPPKSRNNVVNATKSFLRTENLTIPLNIFLSYRFTLSVKVVFSLFISEIGTKIDNIPDFITFLRHHIAQNENQ